MSMRAQFCQEKKNAQDVNHEKMKIKIKMKTKDVQNC